MEFNKQDADFYFGLALDPVTSTCALYSVGSTAEEVDKKLEGDFGDAPYRATFPLGPDTGKDLTEWLTACGVSHSERVPIIRSLGEGLHDILKDIPEKE